MLGGVQDARPRHQPVVDLEFLVNAPKDFPVQLMGDVVRGRAVHLAKDVGREGVVPEGELGRLRRAG